MVKIGSIVKNVVGQDVVNPLGAQQYHQIKPTKVIAYYVLLIFP